MTAHRHVEEIDSTAMLATKMLAGVTPEVNLRECVTHMPLSNINKAAHPEEMSPKVQNRGISGPTKRTYVLQNFF